MCSELRYGHTYLNFIYAVVVIYLKYCEVVPVFTRDLDYFSLRTKEFLKCDNSDIVLIISIPVGYIARWVSKMMALTDRNCLLEILQNETKKIKKPHWSNNRTVFP